MLLHMLHAEKSPLKNKSNISSIRFIVFVLEILQPNLQKNT